MRSASSDSVVSTLTASSSCLVWKCAFLAADKAPLKAHSDNPATQASCKTVAAEAAVNFLLILRSVNLIIGHLYDNRPVCTSRPQPGRRYRPLPYPANSALRP